jgi:anti-anti-sigma factor
MSAFSHSESKSPETVVLVVPERQLQFFRFYMDNKTCEAMRHTSGLYRLVHEISDRTHWKEGLIGCELFLKGSPIVISVSDRRCRVWVSLRSPASCSIRSIFDTPRRRPVMKAEATISERSSLSPGKASMAIPLEKPHALTQTVGRMVEWSKRHSTQSTLYSILRVFQPTTRIFSALNAPDLLYWVNNSLESGAKYLLINFSRVVFMDQLGLEALIMAHRRVQRANSQLLLCSLSGQARMLFDMAQSESLFQIYSSQKEVETAVKLNSDSMNVSFIDMK